MAQAFLSFLICVCMLGNHGPFPLFSTLNPLPVQTQLLADMQSLITNLPFIPDLLHGTFSYSWECNLGSILFILSPLTS